MARWQADEITRLTNEVDTLKTQVRSSAAREREQLRRIDKLSSLLVEADNDRINMQHREQELSEEVVRLRSVTLQQGQEQSNSDQTIQDLREQLAAAGERINVVQSQLWEAEATIESLRSVPEGDADSDPVDESVTEDEPPTFDDLDEALRFVLDNSDSVQISATELKEDKLIADKVTENVLVAAGGWSAPASVYKDAGPQVPDDWQAQVVLNEINVSLIRDSIHDAAAELLAASLDDDLSRTARNALQNVANQIADQVKLVNKVLDQRDEMED